MHVLLFRYWLADGHSKNGGQKWIFTSGCLNCNMLKAVVHTSYIAYFFLIALARTISYYQLCYNPTGVNPIRIADDNKLHPKVKEMYVPLKSQYNNWAVCYAERIDTCIPILNVSTEVKPDVDHFLHI
jgi:hypothetical protein